jgi:hypothetical protein
MLCKSLGFTTSDDEILPEESLRGGTTMEDGEERFIWCRVHSME